MNTEPSVDIIVLNWNGAQDTLECLASLKNISYTNYHIYLVDNDSRLEDREALRSIPASVHYLQVEKNLGFVGGNNFALRQILASSKPPTYVLLLNNDTSVHPDFLKAMVSLAESKPTIGIVGPKVMDNARRKTFQVIGLYMNPRNGRMTNPAENTEDLGQFNTVQSPDWVTGAALLIKTEVIKKIGLLDEVFFAYWEDTDWCQRTREAGYTISYCPQSVIWHKHSASSKHQRKMPIYLSTRNKYIFFRKHPDIAPAMSRLLYDDIRAMSAIRLAPTIIRGIWSGLRTKIATTYIT